MKTYVMVDDKKFINVTDIKSIKYKYDKNNHKCICTIYYFDYSTNKIKSFSPDPFNTYEDMVEYFQKHYNINLLITGFLSNSVVKKTESEYFINKYSDLIDKYCYYCKNSECHLFTECAANKLLNYFKNGIIPKNTFKCDLIDHLCYYD